MKDGNMVVVATTAEGITVVTMVVTAVTTVNVKLAQPFVFAACLLTPLHEDDE